MNEPLRPDPIDEALAMRRSLPAGAIWPERRMRDGWPLRTVDWPEGRGSILLLGGRGDFIEKFAEALHDWRRRGFAVASFDWRGQGGSGRLLADPQKGHSPGFDIWLADLDEQVAWFVATHPAPHFAVAHSMGGHLLLRCLETRSGQVVRAVLLSPMCGLAAAPIGPWLARQLASAAVALDFAESYAPGSGPLTRGVPGSLRQRRLTHDADRYGDEGWWVDRQPELALGGVTSGWLHDAFGSLDALFEPGALERVATPSLVLVAAEEALVDNAATARAVARLPGARLEVIAGAAHELLRETDVLRLPVLDRIAAFLS